MRALAIALLLLQDPDDRRLLEVARRVGSDIDFARDWADASARARREGKLVLVLFEDYGGFTNVPAVRASLFSDPAVSDLVRERFVALEATRASRLPLRDYALGGGSFGAAILFVDADGRVVDEMPAIHPGAFDARAVDLLARREKPAGADAATCLRRGELDRAATLLESPTTAGDWILKASLSRRLRRGADALAALASARAARPTSGQSADIDFEEPVLFVRAGKSADARAAFERALKAHPTHERAGEARLWLCALDGTDARLKEIVRDHPDTRWASIAAMRLLGRRVVASRGARLEWPDDLAMATVARREPAPVAARPADDAVACLLRNQARDGSWLTPAQSGGSELFQIAATALATRSLLSSRERKDVRPTVERGVAWLLEHGPDDATPDAQIDYAVWDRMTALSCLSLCAKAGLGDRAKADAAVKRILDAFAKSQHRGGGWGYARGEAMSFVTAGVILAMLDARAAGAKVEDRMFARALDALAAARCEDGTFAYRAGSGSRSAGQESAGRSAGCALALLKGGRGDAASVQRALDVYLEHRASFRSERGKTICHTGASGQGSHYLNYDYAMLARAIAELPRERREKYRAPLVEDVLAGRFEHGSFQDNPASGYVPATAHALEALR